MPIFHSFVLAFSMFSRIPMPRVEWSKKNMKYMMAFFPLIGVCVAAVVIAWNALSSHLNFGHFLRGTGFVLLPLFITGGFHMDGFCDTVDALASGANPPKKQEILKDSRAGAFAVIFGAAYFLAFAALAGELNEKIQTILCFSVSFVLSRSLSGLALLLFPTSSNSNLLRTFDEAASRIPNIVILCIWTIACVILMTYWSGWAGIIAALSAAVVMLYSRFRLVPQFGGFSGDLAGWLVQVSELATVAGLLFSGKILG